MFKDGALELYQPELVTDLVSTEKGRDRRVVRRGPTRNWYPGLLNFKLSLYLEVQSKGEMKEVCS